MYIHIYTLKICGFNKCTIFIVIFIIYISFRFSIYLMCVRTVIYHIYFASFCLCDFQCCVNVCVYVCLSLMHKLKFYFLIDFSNKIFLVNFVVYYTKDNTFSHKINNLCIRGKANCFRYENANNVHIIECGNGSFG